MLSFDGIMSGSTFSCVGSSAWFTLHLSRRGWTHCGRRASTKGGGLSRHLILGQLLLLLLFVTRSVIAGKDVIDIDRLGLDAAD
jgi:hypothetical protein